MNQDEAIRGASSSPGDDPQPPGHRTAAAPRSGAELTPLVKGLISVVTALVGVGATAALAVVTALAQTILVCVGLGSAAWLGTNARRRKRGLVLTDDGRRLLAAAAVMAAFGAVSTPVEPLAATRLIATIPLLGWAVWLARPHAPAGTPARGGPHAWIEILTLLPQSCRRLVRWQLEPAMPHEPHPLSVVGVVLVLVLSVTASAGASVRDDVRSSPQPQAGAAPSPTVTPTTPPVTPGEAPVSDAPAPVEQPNAVVTPSSPPRPDCARNPAVLRTLSAAEVPDAISSILYEAWSHWTWPVVGCVTTPAPVAGHWVSVVGTSLLVASRDGTQAAVVFAKELSLLQPLLGHLDRIGQSLKIGVAVVQLAHRDDGRCELAGHQLGSRPFLLLPAMTNAVLMEAHHLGAVPFVEGPVPLSPSGPLTVRVRFIGRKDVGAKPRQVEYQALTLAYDPHTGVATIGQFTAHGGRCTRAAVFLDATASAVNGAKG